MHVALRFAYDGSSLRGYARQSEGETVEDALIAALQPEGLVSGSWKTGSRTDKGVAAAQNVAACQLERPHLEGLIPAVSSRLPPGIWLTGVALVDAAWNPRHHAIRTYQYLAPLDGHDAEALQHACAAFVGTHDLSAFARLEPHRDPVRTIESFRASIDGPMICFTVSSPGFLWNQVRRMVDAVMRVGSGQWSVDTIVDALATGTIPDGAELAPAEGLLLTAVDYTPALDWQPAGALPRNPLLRLQQEATVRSRLIESLLGS